MFAYVLPSPLHSNISLFHFCQSASWTNSIIVLIYWLWIRLSSFIFFLTLCISLSFVHFSNLVFSYSFVETLVWISALSLAHCICFFVICFLLLFVMYKNSFASVKVLKNKRIKSLSCLMLCFISSLVEFCPKKFCFANSTSSVLCAE